MRANQPKEEEGGFFIAPQRNMTVGTKYGRWSTFGPDNPALGADNPATNIWRFISTLSHF